eukprot:3619758-Rhodomonas_salina.3
MRFSYSLYHKRGSLPLISHLLRPGGSGSGLAMGPEPLKAVPGSRARSFVGLVQYRVIEKWGLVRLGVIGKVTRDVGKRYRPECVCDDGDDGQNVVLAW